MHTKNASISPALHVPASFALKFHPSLLACLFVVSSLANSHEADPEGTPGRIDPIEVIGYSLPSSPWPSFPGTGWNVGAGINYGGGVFAPNPGNFTQVRDADKKDCSQTSANPVVVTTGNKVESFLDFSSGGEMGLSLRRTYNHYWAYPGLFGRHWISNFDYSLVHENAAATTIWAQRPDGRRIKFVRNGTENGQERFWEDKANPVAKILRNPSTGVFVHHTEDRTQETYNANGYVLTVKNQQGIGWTFTYSGNYLQTVMHTSGRTVQFVWTAGRLTRVIDPDGAQFDYAYDLNIFGAGQHRLKSATLPGAPATLVAYHYEKAGQSGALTGVSYAGVRYSTFDYDSQGRTILSRHHGPAGAVDNFTFGYTGSSSTPTNPPPGPNPPGGICPEPYSVLCELPPFTGPVEDEAALVERARIAEAERLLLSQPLAITQVTETNPQNKVSVHTVQDGRITQTDGQASTHCAASLTQRGYDTNGFPSSLTDAEGNATAFAFDGHGQVQSSTEAAGSAVARTTSYAWDAANNRLNSITVTGDHRQTFAWRSDHRLHSVTVRNLTANGTVNQDRATNYDYTFHGNGMIATLTEDGPLTGMGDAIRYSYNAQGDLTEVRNSLDHATTYSQHNGRGQPGRIVGVNGEAVEYLYDGRGRVIRMRTFRNGVQKDTTYTYAASGLLQSMATPDGITETYVYDSARRLTTATRNGVGGSTQQRLFYDTASNLTKTEVWHTPTGGSAILVHRVQAEYDELGRVIARHGNHGQSTLYGYDRNNRLTSTTRTLGQSTSLSYDALGRVLAQSDADGYITWITYDKGDRVIQVTDPRNLVTSYTYDGFGQLWRQISPDTGTTTQQWNAQGLRTSTTRADGVTLSYSYDSLGRQTAVSAGGVTHTTVWDVSANCVNGKGRICKLSDPHQTMELGYTPYGELAQQLATIEGATGYGHTFQYDELGRLEQIGYPGSVSATYTWTLDQITAMSATVNGQSRSIASGIVFSGNPYVDAQNPVPEGSYLHVDHGNGRFRDELFDTDGRQFGTSTDKEEVMGWLFDENDRITEQWDFVRGDFRISAYDDLDRLSITAFSNDKAPNYISYDANGNRIGESRGARSYSIAWNSNRLMSSNGNLMDRTYTYKATGEVATMTGLKPTVVNFGYDSFNRLSSLSGGVSASYKVAATGMRVAKTVGSATTRFVYGLGGQLLYEHDTNTDRKTQHLYLHGKPIAMVRNNQVYWVHTDHLGRPERLADQNGTTQWRVELDAFTRGVITDNVGGYHLGFPGQYHDTETGFAYNIFRDYDPSTGRYLQPDPIGLASGINLYTYVDGNPINFTDPFGLDTLICARELGNSDKPAMDPNGSNLLRHDYLVVSGEVFSFQAGNNMIFSQGRIDKNEKSRNEKCETISEDPEFDDAVRKSIIEIGAPKYNLAAYPLTAQHILGYRNCQTWARDVLDRARETQGGGP